MIAQRGHRHDDARRAARLHIFGALAQFERKFIRERTVAGLESARARGRAEAGVDQAARMMRDKANTIEDVCATVGGVGRSTRYRLRRAGRDGPAVADVVTGSPKGLLEQPFRNLQSEAKPM